MDHRVGAVQALTVALLLVSQPLRSQEPTISVDVKVVNDRLLPAALSRGSHPEAQGGTGH